MKRATLSVLALLAALPAAAAAQGTMNAREPDWGARVRFTPFVGQVPSVSRSERWVVTSGSNVSFANLDVDLGSGQALGGALEFQLVDRFALIGSGIFVSRGQTREFSYDEGEFYVSEGSNFLLGKLALALRLREAMSEMQLRRLTATVFAGPAIVREMPKDDPSAPAALRGSLTHFGANFGVDAEVPLGQGPMSLQLGIEDYYTIWNTGELEDRNDRAFSSIGLTTQSTLDTDNSHMLVIRAGLSFRIN